LSYETSSGCGLKIEPSRWAKSDVQFRFGRT